MSSFVIPSSASGLPIAVINQTLGRIIAWILVPVCTFLLSDIFWKIYYPDTISLEQSGDIGEQLAVRGQAGNTSTAWEWFQLREPPKPKPVQVARIKATLIGIVGVGESGTAMIALAGKAPKIYRVGDEIQEGVFLSRLGNDHVILLRGETEEKLSFVKADNLFSGDALEGDDSPKSSAAEPPSANAIVSIIKENPLKIGEMVKFETVDTGRYGEGVKVEPGASTEHDLLAKLNLNAGDIVLGIANQRVSDIMADPRAFKRILDEKEFRIQFMREGKLESTVVKMD